MDINVQAQIGACSEFMDDDNNKRDATIIISPLKIRLSEKGDKAQIVTGCNLWAACRNQQCFYSKASKIKKTQSGKSIAS